MINVPTPGKAQSPVSDFLIELNKNEPCYTWNEVITGRVLIKSTNSHIDVKSLNIQLYGSCRLKTKTKKEDSADDVVYVRKEKAILSEPSTFNDNSTEISFQETVPQGLPTSVDTKLGRIGYHLKATLTFQDAEGTDSIVHAVRGITIVEDVDLNITSQQFFEEKHQTVQRKFGLFSCTGGHIKLVITVDRTAFVCGESLTITGRIENKTDRRVEKVAAIVQMKSTTGTEEETTEGGSSLLTDICDVYEEGLALFVDPGSIIKIDKKMHLPVMPPSTPSEEQTAVVKTRRRISVGVLRHRTSQMSLNSQQGTSNRPLRISYQLFFKVKSAGADVMDFVIGPCVVGTIPHKTAHSQEEHENQAIFKQCKIDKSYPINGTFNIIGKTQVSYVNKYPFFADLKTSSKQSKKISILANTIRAENRIIKNLKEAADHRESAGKDATTDPVTVHSIDEISPHKTLHDQTKRTTSSASMLNKANDKQARLASMLMGDPEPEPSNDTSASRPSTTTTDVASVHTTPRTQQTLS